MQKETSHTFPSKFAVEMTLMMRQEEVRTNVLKSNVVTLCYSKPNQRRSVDMDCFLCAKDGQADVREVANGLLKGRDLMHGETFFKNRLYLIGPMVEDHR